MFSLKFVQANIFLFVSRYFALIQFFPPARFPHKNCSPPPHSAKAGRANFSLLFAYRHHHFHHRCPGHAPFLPGRRRRHQGGGHLAPRFSPFIAATRASTGQDVFPGQAGPVFSLRSVQGSWSSVDSGNKVVSMSLEN